MMDLGTELGSPDSKPCLSWNERRMWTPGRESIVPNTHFFPLQTQLLRWHGERGDTLEHCYLRIKQVLKECTTVDENVSQQRKNHG